MSLVLKGDKYLKSLGKFDMLTLVVSHTVCSILFFCKWEQNRAWDFFVGKAFCGKKQNRANFQKVDGKAIIFLFCFCDISRQTVMLISYSFFIFYSMVGKYK